MLAFVHGNKRIAALLSPLRLGFSGTIVGHARRGVHHPRAPEERWSEKRTIWPRFLDHHALVELARGQHGVVSLPQLKPLDIAARVAQKRAANGQLHRIHRGVYSLVPLALLSIRGRFPAAVLARGPGAAPSHRSAATLRDLRRSDQAVIEVTVPTAGPGPTAAFVSTAQPPSPPPT